MSHRTKERPRDRLGRRRKLTEGECCRNLKDVAAEFTRRTGIRMTEKNAAEILGRAERKLRRALAGLVHHGDAESTEKN